MSWLKYIGLAVLSIVLLGACFMVKRAVDRAKDEAVKKALMELQLQHDQAIREMNQKLQMKLVSLNAQQGRIARENMENERKITSAKGIDQSMQNFYDLAGQLNSEIDVNTK